MPFEKILRGEALTMEAIGMLPPPTFFDERIKHSRIAIPVKEEVLPKNATLVESTNEEPLNQRLQELRKSLGLLPRDTTQPAQKATSTVPPSVDVPTCPRRAASTGVKNVDFDALLLAVPTVESLSRRCKRLEELQMTDCQSIARAASLHKQTLLLDEGVAEELCRRVAETSAKVRAARESQTSMERISARSERERLREVCALLRTLETDVARAALFAARMQRLRPLHNSVLRVNAELEELSVLSENLKSTVPTLESIAASLSRNSFAETFDVAEGNLQKFRRKLFQLVPEERLDAAVSKITETELSPV